MEISFILTLALLILLAKVLGELCEKISLPSLVGEILAGIILGPQVLRIFVPDETFHSFAEIGIILLIFIAGFEHGSIKDLLEYKKTSIFVSLLSTILPVIAVIFFSLSLGFSLLTCLFLAVALGATSMDISLRSLVGVKEIDSKVGKTVIGSLVLNDLTGLVLLSGVVGYAGIVTGGEGSLFIEIIKVLLSVIIFFVIFYFGFIYLPKLTTWFMKFKVEEAQFSLAIIIILISAWAASNFGLSSIIGAFFSGIILSRSPVFENHTFVEKVSSLSYGFFIPIFFAMTGALLSFDNFGAHLTFALLLLGMITIIQIIFAFIAAKLSRYTVRESLLVGVGMLPYGEVTLVAMSALISLSLEKPEFFRGQDITGLFSSVLLLIFISIIITPLLMKLVSYLLPLKKSKRLKLVKE